MHAPVLLLIFNRPDPTAQVMEQLREAQPPQLFVSADGPRVDHPGDRERCRRAREVATRVDWDCEVHTLFRDENLGCKEAVSSAITWFFEHVEEGIILEDDCVPHSTFFPFCSRLLERYRYDERIMVISGNNFQPASRTYDGSYYFSVYNHCWGWASWRRSWSHYDGEVDAWPNLRETDWLRGWLSSESSARYWSSIFNRVAQNEVDSWAYPWTFSCWFQHGLSILPSVNLVSNIGFGAGATHTHDKSAEAGHLETQPMSFPMDHPEGIIRNYAADRYTSHNHFPVKSRLRRSIDQCTPDSIKEGAKFIIEKMTISSDGHKRHDAGR